MAHSTTSTCFETTNASSRGLMAIPTVCGPAPREQRRSEQTAATQLFVLHYTELCRLAKSHLRRQQTHTLSETALVHEVYLSMVARNDAAFPDRARFFAYISRAMCGLVIDHARRQSAKKRGVQFEVALEETAELSPETTQQGHAGPALEDALADLTNAEPALAELVHLHFFGGLSFTEIACLRGISERSVRREWERARVMLHRALLDDGDT